MSVDAKVLTQFKEFVRSRDKEKASDTLKNYDFKTESEFKIFALSVIESAQDCDNTPAVLNFLENIITNCLEEANGKEIQLKKDINEKIEEFKKLENTEMAKKAFLVNLSHFIKNSLLDQEGIKDKILEKLWQGYYALQEQEGYSHMAHYFADRTSQAFSGFLAQTQADPLKRAGMMIFEALYTLFDFMEYQRTKGKSRLSANNNLTQNTSGQETELERHYRNLRGMPFPDNAPPPKPGA